MVAGSLGAGGCQHSHAASLADTIYVNGTVLTMSDFQPTAEALAVKSGRILFVGDRASVETSYGKSTKVVDLGGKVLLPGFLDADSHYFSSLTVSNQVNVYPPPAGPGKDPASIVAALEKFRDEHLVPGGELIQAYGYDESVMPNGILLNRGDLDKAFPDNPVIVEHVSMRGAVLNSAALKKWTIGAATKTPDGGIIVRKPGTNEPWGLIMETAFLPILASLPKPAREQEVASSTAGQMAYARAGITTAQEGSADAEQLEIMKRAADSGANIIDIVAYPFITDLDQVLRDHPASSWGRYAHRLKIGGVKITIDGSPQGKTAFFTTPYLSGGPGGERDWRGAPTFPLETVKQMVKRVYDLGVPLNFDANGDAAIDMFLRAHVYASNGDPTRDRHVTLIHAQFIRNDQLEKLARFKVTPSFYTLNTYYFADADVANRGKTETNFTSPMKSAIEAGLHPTNHTGFTVAPLDQMFMLWTAVNRVSRAGEVIGPFQRLSPLEGLKAMSINVAYQYGEESIKGSLEPGKLADMVILDKNPLAVDPMAIKDIKVLETIKEGKTIYKAY
jgi:predicted amidohydrolase YtcJ